MEKNMVAFVDEVRAIYGALKQRGVSHEEIITRASDYTELPGVLAFLMPSDIETVLEKGYDIKADDLIFKGEHMTDITSLPKRDVDAINMFTFDIVQTLGFSTHTPVHFFHDIPEQVKHNLYQAFIESIKNVKKQYVLHGFDVKMSSAQLNGEVNGVIKNGLPSSMKAFDFFKALVVKEVQNNPTDDYLVRKARVMMDEQHVRKIDFYLALERYQVELDLDVDPCVGDALAVMG